VVTNGVKRIPTTFGHFSVTLFCISNTSIYAAAYLFNCSKPSCNEICSGDDAFSLVLASVTLQFSMLFRLLSQHILDKLASGGAMCYLTFQQNFSEVNECTTNDIGKTHTSSATIIIGPIANLKGPYFQPSLSVCVCVCISLTGTSTLQR